jgi:hypothetical protein
VKNKNLKASEEDSVSTNERGIVPRIYPNLEFASPRATPNYLARRWPTVKVTFAAVVLSNWSEICTATVCSPGVKLGIAIW